MKSNINTKISIFVGAIMLMTVFMPISAHADFQPAQIIDPFCWFACSDDEPAPSNIVNSYNTNSNIDSPGASVSTVTNYNSAPAVTATAPATNSNYNYNYNYNGGTSPTVVTAPTVAYTAPSYNVYTQPYIYDTYGYGRVAPQPVYYPVYIPTYSALQASCYTNTSNISLRTGDNVTWYASVSGGTGSYTYSWSGSEGLYGYGSSVNKTYYNTGVKYASVNITSGSQTVNISCTNTVNIYQPVTYYTQPIPVQYSVNVPQYQNNNNGLDVGCFVEPSTASINQPVNWSVEVVGGRAPYTYSWVGSDGLTGNSSSIVKFYSTSGAKSAIVTVTSADGRTATKACSNAVTIRKAATAVTTVAKPKPVTACEQCAIEQAALKAEAQKVDAQNQAVNVPATTLSAFSLSYVPWGWVAILIIFVLFATVMYLLFNRPKI